MHSKDCFQSTAQSCRQRKLAEHASKHDPNTVPMCLSAALHKVRVHSSEKFTLLKVSSNFFEKSKHPNNNSKTKLECIKQLFKPSNNMGFLVHQQGAKLSPTTLCDGWPCICVSPDGRSSTFKEGHAFFPVVLGLEKL